MSSVVYGCKRDIHVMSRLSFEFAIFSKKKHICSIKWFWPQCSWTFRKMAASHLPKATMMSAQFLNFFLQLYLKTRHFKSNRFGRLWQCSSEFCHSSINRERRTLPMMPAGDGHPYDTICWLTIAGQFRVLTTLKETVPKPWKFKQDSAQILCWSCWPAWPQA